METSGVILEKFIKFITNADTLSDDMLGDVVVLEGADHFRTHFAVQVIRNDSA
ncbi:hypothetical protein DCAR_0520284 [Daucus carota subsp. sativus]|uniref:Uncharacterized protein n=1 Tax=Daucus carota subsp. sativus TaxID=79200 RepID=A0A161XS20_DAUCS|nr:hypothetical protein DCAR_0520284 [Daucus carota subsp. sativus]